MSRNPLSPELILAFCTITFGMIAIYSAIGALYYEPTGGEQTESWRFANKNIGPAMASTILTIFSGLGWFASRRSRTNS